MLSGNRGSERESAKGMVTKSGSSLDSRTKPFTQERVETLWEKAHRRSFTLPLHRNRYAKPTGAAICCHGKRGGDMEGRRGARERHSHPYLEKRV